ncbi:MAG: quinolinate synthase NadA [archaeon]
MTDNRELIEKIKKLKKEKNAVFLAHNYQRPEIFEIADFIGDSLDLSMAAAKTDADVIVFCGVDFMAEAAKILSPGKKVLHPNRMAMCPMAQMVTAAELLEMKKKHPHAAVVCYINTSAAVKAESDICCTSANAVEVIESLSEKEIIFVPDKNLAHYIQTKTGKKIIPWEGNCYVHDKILPEKAREALRLHPGAELVVHPECRPDVIALADAVCSTNQMIGYAKKSSANEFIIGTEEGMINRLSREVPEKKFYTIGGTCLQMKKITLENIFSAIDKEKHEVVIDEDVRVRAKRALDRMLALRK